MTSRQETIDDVRKLCDLLSENEDIALPYDFDKYVFPFFEYGDKLDAMNNVRRTIGGKWDKTSFSNYFQLSGKFRSLNVSITSCRDEVCTRVVTGTRTETREVPDPNVPDERPLIQITEEIEDVEWVCPDSLLGSVREHATSTT